MITLDAGNVQLTPQHRRLLMSRLRRAAHLGQRLGRFVLNLTLRRCGRYVTLTAHAHDRQGDFEVRTKCVALTDAFHELARLIAVRLHDRLLVRAVA
ncbi:MAG TPA: hypothetical protein VF595_11720 [Tepidisphaeraceae bacterium]|jgi:hypothetical protein